MYCQARCLRWQERRAYEVYVSEAVRLLGKNTGEYIEESFARIIERHAPVPQRRPEDIMAELQRKGVIKIEPA